jgi:hypothetical protein
MRRSFSRVAAPVLLVSGLLGQACQAHDGPPYPVVAGQRAGPYVVSVWADPDVGTGTFYIGLEPARGTALPRDNAVRVFVRPVSGRLPEAVHRATPRGLRRRVQYDAEVPFDRQEWWYVRVVAESAYGRGEVTAEVEATPPGLGRWDLALYLAPFALVGLLWMYGAMRGTRSPATPAVRSATTG